MPSTTPFKRIDMALFAVHTSHPLPPLDATSIFQTAFALHRPPRLYVATRSVRFRLQRVRASSVMYAAMLVWQYPRQQRDVATMAAGRAMSVC